VLSTPVSWAAIEPAPAWGSPEPRGAGRAGHDAAHRPRGVHRDQHADPATASAYPPDVALTVTAAGRLDTTIWHQELKFGDLLIRDTATTHPVAIRRDGGT
jgi:hypothetical protein